MTNEFRINRLITQCLEYDVRSIEDIHMGINHFISILDNLPYYKLKKKYTFEQVIAHGISNILNVSVLEVLSNTQFNCYSNLLADIIGDITDYDINSLPYKYLIMSHIDSVVKNNIKL